MAALDNNELVSGGSTFVPGGKPKPGEDVELLTLLVKVLPAEVTVFDPDVWSQSPFTVKIKLQDADL